MGGEALAENERLRALNAELAEALFKAEGLLQNFIAGSDRQERALEDVLGVLRGLKGDPK